jgi:predicted HTH domain antitoxin
MKVVLNNFKKITVSAASGVEVYKNNLYLISDNTEGISVCDFNGNLQKLISLSETISSEKILEKKYKSDYEACTIISRNNSDFILLIGSVSKKEHRNGAKLVSLAESNRVETFDLEAFYEELRKKAHIKLEDFNLEALAYFEHKLYFFNRGSNEIISLNQVAFFDFIYGETTDFKITKYLVELDGINGAKAGISGASITSNGIVVFTASAEDTADWYEDGEIVGSSIGYFYVSAMEKKFKVNSVPIAQNEKIIKTKIESVAIESFDEEKVSLFLVSDNDGKASELFQIVLYL